MAAELIDGTLVAARVRDEVKQAIAAMPVKPGLATILVGDADAQHGANRRAPGA